MEPFPQTSAAPRPRAPARHSPARLQRLDAEFRRACHGADRDWLLRHLADDFRIVLADGRLLEREAFFDVCDRVDERRGDGDDVYEDVQFEGDTAVVHALLRLDGGAERATDVWVGRDGRWQLLAAQRTTSAG